MAAVVAVAGMVGVVAVRAVGSHWICEEIRTGPEKMV